MEESADESGSEDISLEDTLESLKRNAKAAETHLLESLKQLKGFQTNLVKESKTIDVPLQPKTRLMKWLTDRGLRVESTFQEFFEAFMDDHKQDHRLDLSARTIQLNTAACVLFGLKDTNPKVHLYDVLQKVSTLYY
jgi:hypothetical protein